MMSLYTRVARRVKDSFDIFEFSHATWYAPSGAGRHARQNPAINPFRFVNQLLGTCGNGFDELKQLRPSLLCKGKARRRSPVRANAIHRNDGDEPLICPTCQALKLLLYAAGHRELGAYSADVCRYGGMFCESPYLLLVASGLAAVWGKFVSIR